VTALSVPFILICNIYTAMYHESSNIYFHPFFFCLAVFMLRLVVIIIVIKNDMWLVTLLAIRFLFLLKRRVL